MLPTNQTASLTFKYIVSSVCIEMHKIDRDCIEWENCEGGVGVEPIFTQ